MKYSLAIATIISVYLLSGCGSGKQLTQKKIDADTYFSAKDFGNALQSYTEIINTYESNNNSQECQVYTKAGESAFKLGETKLAITYLKNASNTVYANEGTYYFLAQAYKRIDNLSLEILALDDYIDLYPSGKYIKDVKTKLFYAYIESANFDQALKLWPEIVHDNNDNLELLEAYFKINKGLNNMDECSVIAKQLLEINKENIVALTWFGKKYYRMAEDRYQKEMKAYENKKTNKQYKKLLSALDIVTGDFKKSLKYFKTIYSIQPTPATANYLSHIYGRLSDKKKAEYYKKLSK